MKAFLLLLLLLVLVAAGCGSTTSTSATGSTSVQPPPTTTAPAETTSFLVYLVDPSDGKLYVAGRTVPKTEAVATAALNALASAPDTNVPSNLTVTIANGDATVGGADLSGAALAQVVYTLTQFSTIKTVNGKTRADVEDFVPAILVERPLPDAAVSSPLRVSGNANTFEATFQYKLLDAAGKVLAQHFVTATSGTGTRGTFDVTIPFTVDTAQAGTLVVYENSAADGSVVHERRVPLRLTP